jgi:hypothetical protein
MNVVDVHSGWQRTNVLGLWSKLTDLSKTTKAAYGMNSNHGKKWYKNRLWPTEKGLQLKTAITDCYVQLMTFWAYPTSCFYFKTFWRLDSVRPQVKSPHFGPIDRASSYLWTPEPTQDRINQTTQPPEGVKTNIKGLHAGGFAPMAMHNLTAGVHEIRVLSK